MYEKVALTVFMSSNDERKAYNAIDSISKKTYILNKSFDIIKPLNPAMQKSNKLFCKYENVLSNDL